MFGICGSLRHGMNFVPATGIDMRRPEGNGTTPPYHAEARFAAG
jgi:hypothetical protein